MSNNSNFNISIPILVVIFMKTERKIRRAIIDLTKGNMVLIHDSDERENETDLIMAARFANKDSIRTMRKDGGGLIVLMISSEIAGKFNLFYIADLYREISDRYPLLGKLIPDDLPYDTKSSFSISINHRKTFTGISDVDRSLTARRFAELAENGSIDDFVREFRSPGHVPICIARKGLFEERKGHTELAVTLLKLANLTPVALGCEMIGEDGRSLDKKAARGYAKEKNLIFLESYEIEEAAERWSEC